MAREETVYESFAQSIADGDFSDYGSEFSPEEESILGDLLYKTVPDTDNPNEDLSLQLGNFEEDDRPHEIRIPLYPFHIGDLPIKNTELSSAAPDSASIESPGKARAKPKGRSASGHLTRC